MPTINQLISNERKKMAKKTKSPAMMNCPQRRGVCTRVYTTTPKKTELSFEKSGKGQIDKRF